MSLDALRRASDNYAEVAEELHDKIERIAAIHQHIYEQNQCLVELKKDRDTLEETERKARQELANALRKVPTDNSVPLSELNITI